MDPSPPWMLFIHGFATGFVTTWLGLLLVNIRPNLKKLVLVGICYAVLTTVVRSAPLSLLIQFALASFGLVIMIMLTWDLSFLRALLPVVIGTIIMGLGEGISMSAIFGLTSIDQPYLANHPLVELVIPLPQIVICLMLIQACLKWKWHIFNFRHLSLVVPNEKRVMTIIIIAGGMLLILMIQVLFNIMINLDNHNILSQISTETYTAISSVAMVTAFLVMVFLIQQLFVLLGKESKYITQTAYLQTLNELYTATQAESHDRINHMQTLYGFVQLGDLEETQAYLEELIGEIIVTQNYLATGHPALSALFYIKSGLATSRGIQFDIITKTRVEALDLPAHELNRILGNLINNAFDSVASLPREKRKVFVEVTKPGKRYRFRIGNCGVLDPITMKNIFNRGYSTKGGEHRGLGLFIVRQMVEKNKGQVEIKNSDDMVIFTVYLPESTLRSASNDWFIAGPG